MAHRIRRLGVLTSGGDSPGSNACIRAVVRMALHLGLEVWGVRDGFEGLMHGDVVQLTSRTVSHTLGRGGTFLGSSRCDAFTTPHGQREALRHLNEAGIDALVLIGGDGSMRGACAIDEAGIPTVGVPATIENDVPGTDLSIGADTALNTALDALDRIKDTASSHEQAFLVELVGRECGYQALMAGVAGGAEMVCIPEVPFSLDSVVEGVAAAYVRGKTHCIVLVASGAKPDAREIASHLESRQEETGFGVRLTMLGHIQRGGSPMARDRLLATQLGAAAVRLLYEGTNHVMVGLVDGEVVPTDLTEVAAGTRRVDPEYLELARMLAQ